MKNWLINTVFFYTLYRYKRLTSNKYRYVFIQCILASLSPAFLNIMAYIDMYKIPTRLVTCSLPDGFQNRAKYLFSIFNALLSVLTLLIYMIIWMFVKCTHYMKNKQILQSITMVTIFVVSGWFFTMTILSLVVKFNVNLFKVQVLQLYLGLFINVSIATNYPIYYWMRYT